MSSQNICRIILISLVYGCSVPKDETKEFIVGVYATNIRDSVSIVNDTFFISPLTSSARDQYSIRNKASYQQTLDGKIKPIQNKTHQWTGTFDEKGGTVVINETGAIIAFDPDSNEMKLGSITYKKLSL